MRYRGSVWPAVLSSQSRPLARATPPPARGVEDGRHEASLADNWHLERALRQLDRMSVYGDESSVTVEAAPGMVLQVDDSGDGLTITEVPEDEG